MVQVGDYDLGTDNVDEFVFGPRVAVYGDGRLFAVRREPIGDDWQLRPVSGRLTEEQLQSLLVAGSQLPNDPPAGEPLADDASSLSLVVGERSWKIDDPQVEPFNKFITGLDDVVDEVATESWVPERWIVHVFQSGRCDVLAAPTDQIWQAAPVYPHLLPTFPLGRVDCYAYPDE